MTREVVSPVPRRRRPLRTVRDCQRELADLYWQMRGGSIDPALGGRLVFTLMSLVRCIEGADFEARLAALEHADGKPPGPPPST